MHFACDLGRGVVVVSSVVKTESPGATGMLLVEVERLPLTEEGSVFNLHGKVKLHARCDHYYSSVGLTSAPS